jgi:uncharacterized protein (TIGR00156 family)
MKGYVFLLIGCFLLSSASFAQFTGPSATGRMSTVTEARNAAVGTYVNVTGNIVALLGEDYYTFRDQSGEVRVEIEPEVWRNRKIGPDAKVRLVAEVDRNAAGTVYLWVESLEIVD